MTIKNFEEVISSIILERGKTYFDNSLVSGLEESEPGLWIAEVTGNEIYMVSAKLTKDEISGWDCDCPFEGEICKHVTALLYAIKETKSEKQKPETKKTSKKKKVSDVESILSKVTREELSSFLTSQFSRFRGLKNVFISHFADLLEEEGESKYRTIVKNIIKGGRDRSGFIDYRSAKSITITLSGLIDKIETLIEKNNIVEGLIICKILIEEVADLSQDMDDSGGEIGCLLDPSFDLFVQISEKAPPQLKDELFNYCLQEFPKSKYHNIGYEDRFLLLLRGLITLDEQRKQFLKLIDDQIEIEKTKEYGRYRVSSLIKYKINFYEENNLQNEAWKLIEENKQYSDFRKMMVDRKINNKKYDEAIALCNEGIKIANSENYSGSVRVWEEKLLNIYELLSNVNEIRERAEKLFFSSNFNMDFYKKLKATYGKEEWVEFYLLLIEKIKNKVVAGGSPNANALAEIFIEENLPTRLLKLLQINSKRIRLVDQYAKHLSKEFPVEILLIYEEAIKSYAENTGRNIYHEVVHYLNELKKIEGGEAKIKLIVNYFRVHYKNRSAMMEILGNKFS